MDCFQVSESLDTSAQSWERRKTGKRRREKRIVRKGNTVVSLKLQAALQFLPGAGETRKKS